MESMEAVDPQQEPEVHDGGGTETEDIPSDFFDEFNKEEFIEGLSIIDSWVDGIPDSERVQKSSKLSDSDRNPGDVLTANDHLGSLDKKVKLSQSPSRHLDEFIKPGSRRDPSKTNEAIKKDKEVKLKEYLAKSLESSDDLRPPGTELDGYFDDSKPPKKDKTPITEKESDFDSQPQSRDRRTRDSPVRQSYRTRESPLKTLRRQWSPRRSPRRSSPTRRSPHRRPPFQQWHHHSPQNFRFGNTHRRQQWSPNRNHSPRRMSPRKSPRRSPRKSPRRSPRKSPRRLRRSRSRSPYKRFRRSRSPLQKKNKDRFLYPSDSDLPPSYDPSPTGGPYVPPSSFPAPVSSEFPGGSSYPYGAGYTYNTNSSYEFGRQPPPRVAGPPIIPGLQHSTPGPLPHPVTIPHITMPPNPVPAPVMVPAPNLVAPNLVSPNLVPPNLSKPPLIHAADSKNPYDALAKLVAEGKISQADYLKLAPNKGASNAADNNQRALVLQRCNTAVHKLHQLHLPNHLMMNNMMGGVADTKYISPQYCSPLKRQAPIEFLFTKANVSAAAQQNKHLVDSIIASLPDLQKVITRPKKKTTKNMKDAAVQTSKPFCDVCEIRESTQFHEASTSTDPGHFCATIHTQVMEQDLINSKSVFAPSGSVGSGAQMSIAHLTPAQLVSQLAARAKTLKQSDLPSSNLYQRKPSSSYEYDGRGGQQYQNYGNYRY